MVAGIELELVEDDDAAGSVVLVEVATGGSLEVELAALGSVEDDDAAADVLLALA